MTRSRQDQSAHDALREMATRLSRRHGTALVNAWVINSADARDGFRPLIEVAYGEEVSPTPIRALASNWMAVLPPESRLTTDDVYCLQAPCAQCFADESWLADHPRVHALVLPLYIRNALTAVMAVFRVVSPTTSEIEFLRLCADQLQFGIEAHDEKDRALAAHSVALAHQAMLFTMLKEFSLEKQRAAVVSERNRMAREIHDTLVQGFTGIIIQLEAAADARSQKMDREFDKHLERAADLARTSLTEARKSLSALRPGSLNDKPLSEAFEILIRSTLSGAKVTGEVTVSGTSRKLPAEIEDNLFRVVQEGTTNVLRHSRATKFQVQLAFASNEVRLNLRDDGCGFDTSAPHGGWGLMGMTERITGLSGTIEISSVPGRGTSLEIAVPI